MGAVLLGVLGVVLAVTAFGASGPSAPSITASPANSPTDSATMTFTFISPGSGNTYTCGYDTTTLTACTSPKSYSGVTVGPHVFRVQTTDRKGAVSAVSSYGWERETTRPTVSSILRADSSPTNASSVMWTVTFSEPVVNVATSSFSLVPVGLTGSPTITGVAGSGATRTVTATTATSTTGLAGSLGLNLSSAGTIADVAGNALTGSVPVAGQVYAIDKKPPVLAWGSTPPDPDNSATANFTWSQSPSDPHFDRFECSKENGPFVAAGCASPFVVDTSNNGQHQFAVRAYDAAGNASEVTYKWKVEKGSIQDFTITGNAVGLLYPGGPPQPIPLLLHNPNSMPITVTSLTVTVVASSLPAGCASSAFQVTQSNVATHHVVVPANGSVTLPSGSTTAPVVTMTDTGASQDACRDATVSFAYSGSAQS